MSNNIRPVLLVGAGPMAVEYAKVLKAENTPFVVVGRSAESAQRFQEHINTVVVTGGLQSFLASAEVPEAAIVATGVEALEENTLALLHKGCRKILVEKPGALCKQGIEKIEQLANKTGAEVSIAYNRRFYASVQKAKQIIEEDGGLREVYFEFTEWAHVIQPLIKAPGVKDHWFLANSTHVVDLAFHFAGFPEDWKAWRAGGNEWHPTATRFTGAGITKRGVLFSYHSDWEGPGRWGMELVTANHRLYLRPLEQLAVQKKGSVAIEPLPLNDETDKLFKPGLYQQTVSWLEGRNEMICSVKEQLEASSYYYQIAGY